MTQPTDSDPTVEASPLAPGPEWVEELGPPADEAERQVQATIRSVSRLEESN